MSAWIRCLFVVFCGLIFTMQAQSNKHRVRVKSAPDKHRCGVCPTFIKKVCAHDFETRDTCVFDNHCIMDMTNCLKGTHFDVLPTQKCFFMMNFGYVHGRKEEDMEYLDTRDKKKNRDYR